MTQRTHPMCYLVVARCWRFLRPCRYPRKGQPRLLLFILIPTLHLGLPECQAGSALRPVLEPAREPHADEHRAGHGGVAKPAILKNALFSLRAGVPIPQHDNGPRTRIAVHRCSAAVGAHRASTRHCWLI